MKVAAQQHYEIQPGENFDALREHWETAVTDLLAACANGRKIHVTMMLEATND